MRYIKEYTASTQVQADLNNEVLGKPYLAAVNGVIDWNTLTPQTGPVYSAMPLTIEITEIDTAITATRRSIAFYSWGISTTGQRNRKYISVSTDGGETWVRKQSTTARTASTGLSGVTIASGLNVGDKIIISGDNISYAQTITGQPQNAGVAIYANNMFTSNGVKFKVYGNIMSLFGDGWESKLDFTNTGTTSNSGTSAVGGLFEENTGLTDAQNLILPATGLTTSCYQSMFRECTNLQYTPKELPATEAKNQNYAYMFWGCPAIQTSPNMLAIEVENASCFQMYYDCSNLNHITCLAERNPWAYDNVFKGWTSGVASTGTFVKNPNATVGEIDTNWVWGEDGIPTGWTVQDADI